MNRGKIDVDTGSGGGVAGEITGEKVLGEVRGPGSSEFLFS
jgi:hypothetical protein